MAGRSHDHSYISALNANLKRLLTRRYVREKFGLPPAMPARHWNSSRKLVRDDVVGGVHIVEKGGS